jgi:predicted enzyme related to lactoylglutathione lyase
MIVPENSIYYLEIATEDVNAVRELYEKSHDWKFETMDPALGNAHGIWQVN